jgi:hypothetical protein
VLGFGKDVLSWKASLTSLSQENKLIKLKPTRTPHMTTDNTFLILIN